MVSYGTVPILDTEFLYGTLTHFPGSIKALPVIVKNIRAY